MRITNLKLFAIDIGSCAAMAGLLAGISGPWWAYAGTFAFGIVQRVVAMNS